MSLTHSSIIDESCYVFNWSRNHLPSQLINSPWLQIPNSNLIYRLTFFPSATSVDDINDDWRSNDASENHNHVRHQIQNIRDSWDGWEAGWNHSYDNYYGIELKSRTRRDVNLLPEYPGESNEDVRWRVTLTTDKNFRLQTNPDVLSFRSSKSINRFICKETLSKYIKNTMKFTIEIDIKGKNLPKIDLINDKDELIKKIKTDTNFSENLYGLYLRKAFSDVKIIVDKHVLPVHRIILASASKVFYASLTSEFKEKHEHCIYIEDFDYQTILNALRYIYSGHIEIEHYSSELFRFADKYEIHELHHLHENYYIKTITIDNVLELVTIADQLNANSLRQNCIEFICQKRQEIIKQNNWKNLSSDIVKELFHCLAQSP